MLGPLAKLQAQIAVPMLVHVTVPLALRDGASMDERRITGARVNKTSLAMLLYVSKHIKRSTSRATCNAAAAAGATRHTQRKSALLEQSPLQMQ